MVTGIFFSFLGRVVWYIPEREEGGWMEGGWKCWMGFGVMGVVEGGGNVRVLGFRDSGEGEGR